MIKTLVLGIFCAGLLFGADIIKIEDVKTVKPWVDIIRVYEELPCPVLSSAPVIDGDISESAWKEGYKIAGFMLDDGSAKLAEETDAIIGKKDNNLYIAFNCKDQKLEDIVSSEDTPPKDVWKEDSIEIFLGPDFGKFPYFQYLTNAKGVYSQNLVNKSKKSRGDDLPEAVGVEKENLGWKLAAKIGSDGWVCESLINLSLLGAKIGNSAGLNLARNVAASKITERFKLTGQWCPTLGYSHQPAKFGKIFFDKDIGITDFKIVNFSKEKKEVNVEIKRGRGYTYTESFYDSSTSYIVSKTDFKLEPYKEEDINIYDGIALLEDNKIYRISVSVNDKNNKNILENKYSVNLTNPAFSIKLSSEEMTSDNLTGFVKVMAGKGLGVDIAVKSKEKILSSQKISLKDTSIIKFSLDGTSLNKGEYTIESNLYDKSGKYVKKTATNFKKL
ncbi:MAG: sugar-binding protein [Candidatus Firestonebacteria bacterium]